MSVLSQKNDIFQKIATLKTASELYINQTNGLTSSFESSFTKNNKDPFLFVVDILKIISGSDSVNKIISEVFSGLNSSEIGFKNKLKSEFASNNGGTKNTSSVPDSIKNGLKLHINKIDFFGDLFLDDLSLQYKDYTDDFTKNLIKSVKSPGMEVILNNSLKTSFDNNTGYFTLIPSGNTSSYNNYMNTLIDNTKFMDSKVLLSSTLDMIFNTTQKNTDQLNLELQIDTILNNFITQEDVDDSYFLFSTEQLSDIQSKLSLSSQLYTEVGCGRVATQLTVENIDSITSGMTYPVSKKVIQTTINNLSTSLLNNSNNPNLKQSDKQSVANGFLSTLLNTLKDNIVRKFMVSPQMNILINMINPINSDDVYNPIQELEKRKNFIKCMMTKIINDLISNLFKLIKKDILEIVSVVALIYTEEGFDKYKKILTSLI